MGEKHDTKDCNSINCADFFIQKTLSASFENWNCFQKDA